MTRIIRMTRPTSVQRWLQQALQNYIQHRLPHAHLAAGRCTDSKPDMSQAAYGLHT